MRSGAICIGFLLLCTSLAAAAAGAETAGRNPLLLPLVLLCLLLLPIGWLQLRTRRNLHGLQELTDNMIDAMTALVIGVDTTGVILEVNQSAADFKGRPKAELIGGSFFELFAEVPLDRSKLAKVLERNAPLQSERVLDGGRSRIWNIHLSPWCSKRQPGVIIRLDEVTEQVQLDTMLVQKEKLITVSRLAVGMIHEINNPLASILQNMQVIHNRLGVQLQKNRRAAEDCGTDMEKIERYLHQRGIDSAIEAVRESARRAARVIENLVNFTRQDEENEAFHSLSQLLERAIDLAGSDFNLKQQYDFRQIQITREFDAALPPVRCRGLKLQQALFALLRFRAEQMLATAEAGRDMTLRLRTEGDQALIELEDEGPLLDEEARRNLFRPSKTDPENALGLCVCHFIICQIHGGTISIEATTAGASRFVVRIPIERSQHG